MAAMEEDSKLTQQLDDCKKICSRLLPELYTSQPDYISESKLNGAFIKTETYEEVFSSPVVELKIEEDNPNIFFFRIEDSEFEPLPNASSSDAPSELANTPNISETDLLPSMVKIKKERKTPSKAKQKPPRPHLNKDATTGKFSCIYCSFQSGHSTTIKNHLLTHTGEMPFACTICAYKARQHSHLKRHLLTHGSETPFACKFCSFRTSQSAYLKRHIKTHTSEKPFACDLCSYRTRQSGSLQSHVIRHTTAMPYACPMCAFRTKRRATLKRHVMVHHTGDYKYTM